ncbi:DUF805 domain-containing protein, partial [Rhizobium ruizarguesonis]
SSYFNKYVDFSGRASRSEFCFSALFVVLVSIVLYLVDLTATLNGIWSLATFLPSIAMAETHCLRQDAEAVRPGGRFSEDEDQ